MKILFISFDYPPLSGGIANLSYQVAKNLTSEATTLIVVAPAVKGHKEFDKKSKLTTYRVANLKIIREIVLFFAILYLTFRFRIEIICNLTWWPSAAVSYFASIFTDKPYIINVYAMDYFEERNGIFNKLKYNLLRAFIKKLAFDRAKKIMTLSHFMKDRLIVRGIDALKIKIIPPGVDRNSFIPHLDPKEVVSKHRLENKKVLLTVSRLDDYKGHDMVIKALPNLISKFPDIAYLIVGTGPHERHLKELAKELKVDNYVIFAGWVDGAILPLYYNACDIFIMLSREVYAEAKVEGYGLVFLEAAACGKPIIAGRSGGIEDAVTDAVTAVVVDPLNLDEIERAVTKILSDKRYAELLGANGLDRIKNEALDWHSISERVRETLIEAKG